MRLEFYLKLMKNIPDDILTELVCWKQFKY